MRFRIIAVLLLLCALPCAAQVTKSGGITAANAACNANNCVFINLSNDAATVSVQLTGTWSATLKPEKTTDGSTWVSAGSDLAANGVSTYNIAAQTGFRIRASAYVSGAAEVTIKQSGATSTSVAAAASALDDLTDVTLTTPVLGQGLTFNGTLWVNADPGLPSRADNDGTVAISASLAPTGDWNGVVNVGHATANAVSIAQAGVSAGNGFIGGFQTIVCTTGAGLTTITPATSTINGYATLTLRQYECARIFVPTEADTNYLAIIDGGQFLELSVELFAPATATATGDGKAYFYVGPKLSGLTLINMYSQVYTAGITNTTNIALDRCAAVATANVCSGTVADMLSVVQTIDSQENSSNDAATAVTINAANALVTAGQVLRFNVDAISTTPAQGLQVTLRFRK